MPTITTLRKRLFFLFVAAFLFAPFAAAQNTTTVTATIADPNGVPYSFATVSAQLISSGTPTIPPPCNGQSVSPCAVSPFSQATADSTGTFSMNLASNAVLSPGGSQWQFTVNMSPGVGFPFGMGPQKFTVTLTISGSTQNISTNLSAVAPALTRTFSGGGTGAGNLIFLSQQPGATAGDKFTAAVTALSSSGGVIVADLLGPQQFNSDVFSSVTKMVQIWWTSGQYLFNSGVVMPVNISHYMYDGSGWITTSGNNVQVLGGFSAGSYQIFQLSGYSTTVTYTDPPPTITLTGDGFITIPNVTGGMKNLMWWGAKPDFNIYTANYAGATDNSDFLKVAVVDRLAEGGAQFWIPSGSATNQSGYYGAYLVKQNPLDLSAIDGNQNGYEGQLDLKMSGALYLATGTDTAVTIKWPGNVTYEAWQGNPFGGGVGLLGLSGTDSFTNVYGATGSVMDLNNTSTFRNTIFHVGLAATAIGMGGRVGITLDNDQAYSGVSFDGGFFIFIKGGHYESSGLTPAISFVCTSSLQTPYLMSIGGIQKTTITGNGILVDRTGCTNGGDSYNLDGVLAESLGGAGATVTATVASAGTATYTVTTTGGDATKVFAIGQFLTVTGTTNGSGVFNVSNAKVTGVTTTSVSIALVGTVGSASDTGTIYTGHALVSFKGSNIYAGFYSFTNVEIADSSSPLFNFGVVDLGGGTFNAYNFTFGGANEFPYETYFKNGNASGYISGVRILAADPTATITDSTTLAPIGYCSTASGKMSISGSLSNSDTLSQEECTDSLLLVNGTTQIMAGDQTGPGSFTATPASGGSLLSYFLANEPIKYCISAVDSLEGLTFPSCVTATPTAGQGTVNLAWAPKNFAAGYYLSRTSGTGNTNPGHTWSATAIATPTQYFLLQGTSFTDTSATNGTDSGSVTRAWNDGGVLPTGIATWADMKVSLNDTHWNTTTPTFNAGLISSSFQTKTNCTNAGTAANPSIVSCGTANSGAFSCDPAASTGTCLIQTTAAGTNSNPWVQPVSGTSWNTRLGVTCSSSADTGLATPRVGPIVNGVSLTINLGTFGPNPLCFIYGFFN